MKDIVNILKEVARDKLSYMKNFNHSVTESLKKISERKDGDSNGR